MSHVTYIHESRPTSRVWMIYVTFINVLPLYSIHRYSTDCSTAVPKKEGKRGKKIRIRFCLCFNPHSYFLDVILLHILMLLFFFDVGGISHLIMRHVNFFLMRLEVMSHVWMSHVTWMDESCHIMNESCHVYEWVMSHVWMNYVTCIDELCHMNEWVMSHTWMSHVTCMSDSCHMYGWVISHVWMSHVTCTHKSCHRYEGVM